MTALSESELAEIGRQSLFNRIVADYCWAKDVYFPSPTGVEPPEPGMHLAIVATRKQLATNLAPRLVEIGKLDKSVLDDLTTGNWESVESKVYDVLDPAYQNFRQDKQAYLRSRGVF